jgi:heat shock protein HslJ
MLRILLSLPLLAVVTLFAAADTSASPQGKWRVTEIAGRATNASVTTTFELSGNGNVAGDTGCNRYRAQGKLKGNRLTFGLAGSTTMNCQEPQMAQETSFLAQLPEIRGWRLERGKLLLIDAQNNVILRAER